MKNYFIAIILTVSLCCVGCRQKSSSNTVNAGERNNDTPVETIADTTIQEIGTEPEPSTVPDTGISITDGYFRVYEESGKKKEIRDYYSNNDFLAIWYNMDEDTYHLSPVEVKVGFDVNGCTGDDQASLKAYKDGGEIGYRLLIEGLEKQDRTINHISTGNDDMVLYPSQVFDFTFNETYYQLYAVADTTKTGDAWNSSNYRLYLREGVREQLLTTIGQLEHQLPSLSFAGDIDGDGLPDFLINEGYNYEYHKIVLYLSSYAKEDELVKAVAIDEEWRDC